MRFGRMRRSIAFGGLGPPGAGQRRTVFVWLCLIVDHAMKDNRNITWSRQQAKPRQTGCQGIAFGCLLGGKSPRSSAPRH